MALAPDNGSLPKISKEGFCAADRVIPGGNFLQEQAFGQRFFRFSIKFVTVSG
jgi:hypothetical protein